MTEYAEILRAIADGRAVQWQMPTNQWVDQDTRATLEEIAAKGFPPECYRVKPHTITIGGYEVPEPLRVAPAVGVQYWLVDLHQEEGCMWVEFESDGNDNVWLARGLCHATKEAAELHARALLSFTTQGVSK